MDIITVLIFVESRYPVNRRRIKSAVINLLKKQEIHSPVEVSVAIIGDRKMKMLNKKYRGLDKTTNVLSFSLTEGQSIEATSDVMRLGDVVISYPQVIKEASAENSLVDDRIDLLVQHGLMHLLGLHHE